MAGPKHKPTSDGLLKDGDLSLRGQDFQRKNFAIFVPKPCGKSSALHPLNNSTHWMNFESLFPVASHARLLSKTYGVNAGTMRTYEYSKSNVFSGLEAGTSKLPEITSIVPTIKDETYINLSRKSANEGPTFVHEHFVADLWIVCAIDSTDAILTLSTAQFVELKMTLGELKHLAIENLKRMLPPIERHGEGPVYTLTAGSDYVASLLLFEDLWAEQAEVVDGEIVAAVPARGALLFTGNKSSHAILELRRSVSQLTQTSGYLVSTTMLRRSPDGWKVFS